MDVKKYISLGVSAVLVLTGGLLSIKSSGTNIKAGAGDDESVEVTTMKGFRKAYEDIESVTMRFDTKSSSTNSQSISYGDESQISSSTQTVEMSGAYYVTEEEYYAEVEAVLHREEYSQKEDGTAKGSTTLELTYALYINDDGDEAIRIDKYEVAADYEYDGDYEDVEEYFDDLKAEYEDSMDAVGEYLGEWLECDSIDDEIFVSMLKLVLISRMSMERYFALFATSYDDKEVCKKESDVVYKMKPSAFEDVYGGIGSLKMSLELADSPTITFMHVDSSEFDVGDDDNDIYGDIVGDTFYSSCVMAEYIMTNINNTEIKAPKKMDVETF